MSTISCEELKNKIDSNQTLCLVDVRSPAEYLSGHVPNAINCPLDSLDPNVIIKLAKNAELVFLCKSGMRATSACESINKIDNGNATFLKGGTASWIQAGYDVIKAQDSTNSIMSIERQVRIGAGLLVLVGVILSLVFLPFILLSAFVGAGLIFAGITDWCGMGLLLAKMPWNKKS